MRKAITFVVSSVLTGLILLIALFVSIVAIPNDVFYDHYMKMLSTKYDTLKNTDSPKIIIISGSSAAFCLDGDMLADRTGMNVVNTGLHVGIGARFEAEMSKANINKGDIVLLEYEWGWATDEKYTDAETVSYKGRALAVLRSGYEKGQVRLNISGEGVHSAEVTLDVE